MQMNSSVKHARKMSNCALTNFVSPCLKNSRRPGERWSSSSEAVILLLQHKSGVAGKELNEKGIVKGSHSLDFSSWGNGIDILSPIPPPKYN